MTTRTDELLVRLRVEADQALRGLKQVENQTKATTAEFSKVGRNSRRLSSNLQNAGYQIQDFAVQVGSGTDAMRAFSQQAPQLLGAFGGIGIAVGTAVAVLAPLVKVFLDSADASKEASNAIESFNNILGRLSSAGGGFDRYAKLVATADEETRSWLESLYEVQGALIAVKLDEATSDLDKYIESLTKLTQGQRGGPNQTLTLLRNIKEEFKLEDDNVARQLLDLLKQAEEGAISAQALNTELLKIANTSELTAKALEPLTQKVAEVAALTIDNKEASKPFDDIAKSVDDLTGVDDILGDISYALIEGLDGWANWGKAALEAANPDPFEQLMGELSDVLAAANATAEAMSSLGNLADIGVTFDKPKKDGEEIKTLLEELQTEAGKWADQFADTLVSGLAEGKLAFKDFANYVIEQLARIALSKALEPLFNSFGNFIGGITGAAAPVPTGLIAVPANDLPISREMSSAQPMIVGVPRMSAPSSSGSPVTVNVYNQGSNEVEVNERKTTRGVEVDVLIKNAVKKGIAAGDFDKVMATSYGARRMAF